MTFFLKSRTLSSPKGRDLYGQKEPAAFPPELIRCDRDLSPFGKLRVEISEKAAGPKCLVPPPAGERAVK